LYTLAAIIKLFASVQIGGLEIVREHVVENLALVG
jgi:hypothetical protein